MTDTTPEDTEPRYTLTEAALILQREACDTEGHLLEQTVTFTPAGSVVQRPHCTRCGATFTEDTQEPPQ